MELFWTKKTQIESVSSDPLGFSNKLRIHFFDTLFVGLTLPVTRAKYYLLYPRFILSLEKYNCLDFSNLLKLERAYLIAATKHGSIEKDKDHNGILGADSYPKSIKELEDFNFEIFQNNKSGFNRLKENLVKLGLFKPDPYNKNNEIKIKLTSFGRKIADKKIINPNFEKDQLINNFITKDCLCSLSHREKTLLEHVFMGDLKVEKHKEEFYDVVFDKSVSKAFDIKEFFKKKIERRLRVLILSKIRFHSLIFFLSVFRIKRENFISAMIEDCFVKKEEFSDIKQLWRGYFLTCGLQEVMTLALYLIYEIIKYKWDGKKDQEKSATFEEIKSCLEIKLLLSPIFKYRNFSHIIKESQQIIGNIEMNKNKDENLKKIPNLIKEYCRILNNAFHDEHEDLIDFIENMDIKPSNYTLRNFIEFYKAHENLDERQYTYLFFKDFCLPRQNAVIDYRNYRGIEKILLYETENEIISFFSELKNYSPRSVGVLIHSKLSINLFKIMVDLGLIENNVLTKKGEQLVRDYNG